MCSAILAKAALMSCAARASSLKAVTSQLAAMDCTAAVKLSVRGDTPAFCADWRLRWACFDDRFRIRDVMGRCVGGQGEVVVGDL